jgi:hypothetical protein
MIAKTQYYDDTTICDANHTFIHESYLYSIVNNDNNTQNSKS